MRVTSPCRWSRSRPAGRRPAGTSGRAVRRWHTARVLTLLRGGRIRSPAGPEHTAVLLDDGVIAWVGGEDAAAGLADAADRIVPLAGALVTPAFVDAHVHLTPTGLATTTVDLRGSRSLAEALARVGVAAKGSGGGIVLGAGWDESSWPERRAPTLTELARVTGPDTAVYLSRVDAHSGLVSAPLIARHPELAALPGYADDGWLRTQAHTRARQIAFASLTDDQRHSAQVTALQQAAERGIGCVHEMATPQLSSETDLADLLALNTSPATFPLVIGYWGELHGVETAVRLGAAGAAGDLSVDGSVGSHTAAMSSPYADAPTSGTQYLSADEIAAHVIGCTRAGIQAGFHAIGDAAVDAVITGMEHAAAALGGAAVRGAGHRIEHAELVTDVRRMAAAGLLASVQPVFDATWGGSAGMYADRLGAERAGRMNDLAALASAGVTLALGSDTPVTDFDPWAAVRAAAYPHRAESAISTRAAFSAHTRGGWRAAGRSEHGEGLLVEGAPATIAVWQAGELVADAPDERVARWSTDPRAGVPALPDLRPGQPLPRCLMTVVDGAVVYDAAGS
ncbi:MAG: amidohydrolase [Jatrophihabitans sp.]